MPDATPDTPATQPGQDPQEGTGGAPQEGGQPEPETAEDDLDTLDLDRAREAIRQRNAEARNLRKRLRELEPLAQEAEQRRQAELTEVQRVTQRAEAAERERDEARQEATRLRLAARYGLQEDDLDLLGVGTDEVLEGRAKRLAERLGSSTAPARGGGRRLPTERLIPTSGVARTEDDLSPTELSRLIRGGSTT